MQSHDGRYVIVFNGEIYNHAELRPQLTPSGGWRGTSDTETLLEAYRAWGVNCLERLNGMFAFAIWDQLERRLFLARDRMGVKPLYYAYGGRNFAFGSRPGAVVPLAGPSGHDMDPSALRLYLELGYIPAPLSYYRHVRKLGAGHYLLVDESGLKVVRYWDYRHIPPDPALLLRPEGELVEELDGLIREAVRARLMSDVPFGAFLSGGVDSSMVVAAMKASGVSDPKTFTIAFREKAYDEGPQARSVAETLGVQHVSETLSVEDLLQLLPLYVEEFDEPFADSSAFPTMAVARLARTEVTVALTGDAADELFGGYHYYPAADLLTRITKWPRSLRSALGSAAGTMRSHRGSLLAGALRLNDRVDAFSYMRSLSKDFAPLLPASLLRQTDSSQDRYEEFAAGFAMDLTSAEVGMRCPFTDYRLVEWCMRLPVSYKLRGWDGKYLLKKALCRYLPPGQVYRKKRGFGVPIAQWLRGPLKSWARDLLHEESVLSRLPLERELLTRLFDLHISGSREAHPLLWAVLMLLCFVAKHDRGIDLPSLPKLQAA
jgi:asparagine synthase (glutamine-hydrolysing)